MPKTIDVLLEQLNTLLGQMEATETKNTILSIKKAVLEHELRHRQNDLKPLLEIKQEELAKLTIDYNENQQALCTQRKKLEQLQFKLALASNQLVSTVVILKHTLQALTESAMQETASINPETQSSLNPEMLQYNALLTRQEQQTQRLDAITQCLSLKTTSMFRMFEHVPGSNDEQAKTTPMFGNN